MEFKEKEELQLRQICDICGNTNDRCFCTVPQPQELATPQRVGGPLSNYVLGEQISDNKRSSTSRARHAVTGQVFAIKMLKTPPIEDRTTQRKLQQEGKAITALNHPNIAAVYDYGLTSDNQPFVARDYIDGINLGELIDKEGSLDNQRFLDIFLQIADALAHAHQSHVLHLSLKPENIILAKHGDDGSDFVKVVDCGISRMISSQPQEASNQYGNNAARYLSPEQCSGEVVSTASDIYAFGCVMYEALCGHPPFEEGDHVQIMQKQIRAAPPPLSKVARQPVSRELESLVARCLAKDPRFRPQSGKELECELQGIANGTTTADSQPVPSRLRRSVDTSAPEPAWFSPARSVLVIAALALIAGTVAIFALWRSQQEPVVSEVPKPVWRQSFDSALKDERQGNLQSAEAYLQQALREAEQDGAKEKDLADILAKLGSQYYSSSRSRDAAPFLMRALPLYERIEGPMGPDVDWIATDLAEIAQTTENWPTAIQMYTKLQPIKEKQSGKDSAKYAQVLAGLGGAYVHTHDYKSAEKYLRASLAIREKLGPDSGSNDIAASKSMLGLGYILDTQGRVKEAEKLYKDALATCKKARPPKKEVTAKAMDYYSNFLMRTGRRVAGEKLSQQARVLRGMPAAASEASGPYSGATVPGAEGKVDRAISKTGKALEGTKTAIYEAGKLLGKAKDFRDRYRLR